MKNNIIYYQHFTGAHKHPKFKLLRCEMGWSHEGRFWALNGMIGDSENCELDLSKKYNVASIASDLDLTIGELDIFIDFLVDQCELLIRENNCITTTIVQENLEKVMKERKRNQLNYEKRKMKPRSKSGEIRIKPDEIEIQHVEFLQSKVKERKVKESKGKKAIAKTIPPLKEWVVMYFQEREVTGKAGEYQADRFFDNFESNGWLVGKSKAKMKDWQAAVRNWIKNMNEWGQKADNVPGGNKPRGARGS